MPFDGIAVRCQAAELSQALTDGKIDKIYQPSREELLLNIRTKDGLKRLLFSASAQNARVTVITSSRENPASPPMFCMLLRKHLSGGKITRISQPGLERILDVSIACYTELGDLVEKHIIAELMGKHSNIICVDERGRVIDSIKHVDMNVSAVRNVLPGITYQLPPDSGRMDPLTTGEQEIKEALSALPEGMKWDKGLVSLFTGISPLAAREMVYRAFGDADLYVGEGNIDALSGKMAEFFSEVREEGFLPVVLYDANGKTALDFAAYRVEQYGTAYRTEERESLSDAMEEFYEKRALTERMKQRTLTLHKTVSNLLTRCYKKMSVHEAKLRDAEKREQDRQKGELITANLYRMQEGDTVLVADNYYEEGCPKLEIRLDPMKTPAQNAQQYFKKYTKLKHAEQVVTEQQKENLAEIEYLESVLHQIEEAETEQDIREIRSELLRGGYLKEQNGKQKKETKVSEPMSETYRGYTILVGRNNLQNDYLTLRLSRANDLWLHAKNVPASHVIVKYQGEAFPHEVVERAARLAALHSKAKHSPKVEVDYTEVKHVHKPNGAKPGMVIYEQYQTAYVEPAEE